MLENLTKEEKETLKKNIILLEKYKYYKSYVEPLESEFDDLAFKFESVKEENKKLKKRIKNSTYYKVAKNLKFKLNEREELIKKQKIEIDRLKKELDVYKSQKLKGELK